MMVMAMLLKNIFQLTMTEKSKMFAFKQKLTRNKQTANVFSPVMNREEVLVMSTVTAALTQRRQMEEREAVVSIDCKQALILIISAKLHQLSFQD